MDAGVKNKIFVWNRYELLKEMPLIETNRISSDIEHVDGDGELLMVFDTEEKHTIDTPKPTIQNEVKCNACIPVANTFKDAVK